MLSGASIRVFSQEWLGKLPQDFEVMFCEVKMQIVKVHWEDSKSNECWEFHGDMRDSQPVLCTSVGFLIAKTRKAVVLCLSDSKNQTGQHITIPRSCVKEITKLEVQSG